MSSLSKRLKILIIADNQSLTGGAETFIWETAKNLAQAGHQVYLIEGADERHFRRKEILNKVKIYRYPIKGFSFLELNISVAAGVLKIFNRLSKKIEFNVIHLHLYTPAFAILFFIKKRSVPTILHFYGVWYLETLSAAKKRPIKLKVKILLQKIIQSYCLKKANKVIALSKYCKKLIIKKFNINPKKIIAMPGGIDCKTFFPLTQKKKITSRKHLGFDKNLNILLIVSRIEPRKGIDNAIKAMSNILKSHSNSILLIISPAKSCVGQQHLSHYYNLISKLKLGGKIFFTTGLTKEKLTPFYQIADCFLMVSKNLESFGLTTIESLACGTPALGTATGATPEILNPLDKKLIIKNANPKSIASKINFFISLSKKEKNNLSQKSAQYIKKNYSWKKQIKIFEKCYYNLVC